MNCAQELFLRAHYLACYQNALAAGFNGLAQAIYEFYCEKWPNELLNWPLTLGGPAVK
jgi:hypothetical protein